MNTPQSCLPVEVRTAVYRRALAHAYLDTCAFYRVNPGYTLDELQMAIAMDIEGYFVRQHGAEVGMDMACTMLSDMVQPDILVAPPRLTTLGQKMMDELWPDGRHLQHHRALREQNNDRNKRFSHLTCSDRPLAGLTHRAGHSHYCRGPGAALPGLRRQRPFSL